MTKLDLGMENKLREVTSMNCKSMNMQQMSSHCAFEPLGGGVMRNKADVMADLVRSVETWNMKLTEDAVNEAIRMNIPPVEIIRDGLGAGMETIGKQFNEAKLFLPQVVAASKAMELAIGILEPHMEAGETSSMGNIIMGSVRGDIHEIGKDVCCAMLRGAGYNVIDIGSDQTTDEFIEKAKKTDAIAIGASALMTTTLVAQKELVECVRNEDLKAKVLIGGAPCSQQWADEIGADGYSANGSEIVALVRKTLKVSKC